MGFTTKYFQVLIPIVLCIIGSFALPSSSTSYQIVIFTSVLAAAVIVNNKEQNFALLLGLIPIDYLLARETGQSVFTWVILVILLKDLFLIKGSFLNRQVVIAFLALLLWELFHLHFYNSVEYSWGPVFTTTIKLFITIFYMSYVVTNVNLNKSFELVLLVFATVLLFSGVYGIISFMNVESISNPQSLMRQDTRLGGYGFNVNRFAGLVVIVIASIPLAIQRKKLNNVLLFSGFFVFVVLGFLTGSRSFLLAIILLLLGMVSFTPSNRENNSIKSLGVIVIVIATFILIFNYELVENYIETIRKRFLYELQEGGTRIDIAKRYLTVYISNPIVFLFGYGIISYFYVIGFGIAPHNFFIEPFLAWGISGVIVLTYFLRKVYIVARSVSETKYASYFTVFPIILYLVQSTFSSIWTEQYFYLLLVFCIQTIFISSIPSMKTRGKV